MDSSSRNLTGCPFFSPWWPLPPTQPTHTPVQSFRSCVFRILFRGFTVSIDTGTTHFRRWWEGSTIIWENRARHLNQRFRTGISIQYSTVWLQGYRSDWTRYSIEFQQQKKRSRRMSDGWIYPERLNKRMMKNLPLLIVSNLKN
jgi:hypothetical protein